MDIYNLFESNDMRKHLKKIGYKFSTAEAAFLVYVNDGMTIKQKHAAWREIIDTMPNCSLDARLNMKAIPDFHEFLKKYIALEERFIDEFYRGENCVWQFEYSCDGDDGASEDGRLFANVGECLNAVEATLDENDNCGFDTKFIYIYKQPLSMAGERSRGSMLILNNRKQPISISPSGLSGNDSDIYDMSFDGMWFDFPTPFKHGDIVTPKFGKYSRGKGGGCSFVLHSLPTWDTEQAVKNGVPEKECEKWDQAFARFKKDGDITDMDAYGYCIRGKAPLFADYPYYDLEYYRGELKDEQRVLSALSEYMKDEIDLIELLDAYGEAVLDRKAMLQIMRRG